MKSYNILIGIFLIINLAFLGFFINYTIVQKNTAKENKIKEEQNQIKEEQNKIEKAKIEKEKEIERKEKEVQEELMNDSFYVSLLNSKKNCTNMTRLNKIIELMELCENCKRMEKGLEPKFLSSQNK